MRHKKHGSNHHIVPQSRNGPRAPWNESDKKTKKHQNWHIIFDDKIDGVTRTVLPCEAINKINNELTTIPGYLKRAALSKKQLKAWDELFGKDALPEKAVKIIEEEWTHRWCFQFKGCLKFDNPKKRCPALDLNKKED